MGRIGWTAVAVLGVASAVAILLFAGELLRAPAAESTTLIPPRPGEVRADYLNDGTPVWVIGHPDGEVAVLSGFDAHRPANIGKLMWWCPTAEALEDPAHGSKYDGYGLKIGGPAPSGLPRYATTSSAAGISVGALGPAPPFDQASAGPHETDREWCRNLAATIYHRFEGWRVHRSPTEAVRSAPAGWILLVGELAVEDGAVIMCAIDDCTDAVPVEGLQAFEAPEGYSPFAGERFIARVRDGALVDVARALPVDD